MTFLPFFSRWVFAWSLSCCNYWCQLQYPWCRCCHQEEQLCCECFPLYDSTSGVGEILGGSPCLLLGNVTCGQPWEISAQPGLEDLWKGGIHCLCFPGRLTCSAAPGTWRSPQRRQLFPFCGSDCQDSLWDQFWWWSAKGERLQLHLSQCCSLSRSRGVKCLSRGAVQAGKYEKWQMCRARRSHFYLLPFQTCPSMSLLQGRERADNFPCLENGASHSSN